MPYYLYSLNDPETGECRYIGQTVMAPKLRFYAYRREAKAGSTTYVSNWWRSLPKEPIMNVIGEVLTREMANYAEVMLIEQCKAEGVRLTNTRAGGMAGELADETKQKISSAMKGKPKSPEHRAKLMKSVATARTFITKESMKKSSESHKGQIPGNKGKTFGPLTEKHREAISRGLLDYNLTRKN